MRTKIGTDNAKIIVLNSWETGILKVSRRVSITVFAVKMAAETITIDTHCSSMEIFALVGCEKMSLTRSPSLFWVAFGPNNDTH